MPYLNTNTDIIVAVAFGIFFLCGWMKGFLRSLAGPLSLVVGSLAGIAYYRQTQNIALALTISTVGPFFLNFALSFFLKTWRKTINKDQDLSLISHILGGCFTTLWSGTIFILFFILLTLIPGQLSWLKNIQNDIHNSAIYNLINTLSEDRLSSAHVSIENITELAKNPSKFEEFADAEKFDELMDNPTFSDLFSDEETLQQIENKNISELLTNPKMQSLLEDKNLLQKIMEFQQDIIKKGFKSNLQSNIE